MKKLNETQCPDIVAIRKTLVGLGNTLIQAELATDMSTLFYEYSKDFSFRCGSFKYEINSLHPFVQEEYDAFVKSIEDYMRETIKDYESRIFELECSKAIMEVYLSERQK